MENEMKNEIIEKFETYQREHVRPWFKKLQELGLSNVSPDSDGLRMYAYKAHHAGRYNATEEERKMGVSCIVTVPFTAEEREALDNYYRNVEVSNAMYPEYKQAINDPEYKRFKFIEKVKQGKIIESRYPGKSTLTGKPFPAGEKIYFAKINGASCAVPVSEVE